MSVQPAHASTPLASATCPLDKFASLQDSDLVRSAQQGDVRSLELLFRRHLPRLRRYAARLCADSAAAEDICQEACRKAMNRFSKLRRPDRFGPWLAGFITNEARRAKKFSRNSHFSGTEHHLEDTYTIETMRVAALNDSEADLTTLLARLRREIQRMTKPCRQVAACMLESYARYQEFPPVRAIARLTHLPLGTAERARQTVLHAWQSVIRHSDL